MTRTTALRWILPATLMSALAILVLWLTRPTWMVISENPSYVLSVDESAGAVTGTILIALVLAAILFVARRPPSPTRTLALALLLAAIVVVFLGVNLALLLGAFPSSMHYA